jgi:outer membrane receptor protein involved in Fe transport
LKGLSFSLTYTYLDSKQNNREVSNALNNTTQMVERRALGLPQHQARLGINYNLPCNTRLHLTARYLGQRVMYYDDYSNFPQVTKLEKKIKAHYTLDLKATHPFGKHWEAALSFLNLTDQQYVEQAGTSFNDRDYPAPGRSVTVGVIYRF